MLVEVGVERGSEDVVVVVPAMGVIVREMGMLRAEEEEEGEEDGGRDCIITMIVITMTITVGEGAWEMMTSLPTVLGRPLSVVDGVVVLEEDMVVGEGGGIGKG
jgi:hypothetical protein